MTMFEGIAEECITKQGTYMLREEHQIGGRGGQQQGGSSGNGESMGKPYEDDLNPNELFDMFTPKVRQTILESILNTILNGDLENSTAMLCTCRMARVEAYDEWSHALEHHYEKIKKALSHNVKARCFLWRLFTRKVIPGFALFTFENTINLNKQKFTQLEKSLRKLQAVDKQLKEGKSQQEPDAASLPVQVDWASVMPSDNPSCPNGWHML